MTLHELLGLERPLLIFDTETTGPNPREDRIVEIGFVQIKPDGSLKEWQSFLNPGIPIPREATHGNGTDDYPGHGITDVMVQSCRTCGMYKDHEQHLAGCPDNYVPHDFLPWPMFRDLADNFLLGFSNTDFGGFNIKRFDLPLMQAEFARNGKVWEYHEAAVLDGFRLWQLGQKRTLGDAVKMFLARHHEGAHRAIDDVRATVDVLVAQLQMFTALPRNLKALDEKCWPKNPNAIDPDGKIIWKDGEAVMNFGSKWRGKPLKMMARNDLQWIAGPKCDGVSAAVKRICEAALDGNFPKPLLKEIVDEP
jgi:DNA polymerase-3 subunit epsilon